ncbi:hypothetical protein [Deinococcus ruber]|nr:hypothetical protein [Deinococcus ruber]
MMPPRCGVWFHGTQRGGAWQRDPAHPGIWFANRRVAAQWYAAGGSIVQATLMERRLLNLNDPADLWLVLHRSGHWEHRAKIRHWHARGQLYLLQEGAVQNALVAAAFASHPGLIMQDCTAGVKHLSLVVHQDRINETITRS